MAVKLVLLHSPLVGPGTWRLLAPLLRARGYDVGVPDFSPAMRSEGPYYPRLVQIARAAIVDPRNTVLVPHSGAGALIAALAGKGGARGSIFVDALLPHPGQSWFETAPETLRAMIETLAQEGSVPPWHLWWPEGAIEKLLGDKAMFDAFASELHRLPLSYFAEAAPAAALSKLPACAYLQLGPMNDSKSLAAERNGWLVERLALHHLAMLTHPSVVAESIERLLGKMDIRRT